MRKATKPITLRIERDEADFFGCVLISAVRYCIGRRTYMPGLVTDWIMGHCAGLLARKTLAVMAQDIDEAESRSGLGMDCDVRTWQRFRAWVREEMERDGQ